jgi:4a-hydroxytetrahydrobiopterin dehydratase
MWQKRNGDSQASKRPQAGNDAERGVAMRVRRGSKEHRDYLADAFALLHGWTREGREIRRTLRLDDSQHAALTESMKVVADSLQLRPEVRRLDGHTQIRVRTPEGEDLSAGEVALAARIEDLYRRITGVA